MLRPPSTDRVQAGPQGGGCVIVRICALGTEGPLVTSGRSVLVRPPEIVIWSE